MSKLALYGIFLQALCCSLLVASSGNAQEKLEEIEVKVSNQKSSLYTIFRDIEAQTEFEFSYNDAIINLDETVQLKLKRPSLYHVLREISREAKLKFKRIDESIYVSTQESSSVKDVEEVISILINQVKISGTVTSVEDGEPLPGVSIIIKGTTQGTTTDFDGKFSLNVSEDAVLKFSYIGYESLEVPVGNSSELNIELKSDLEQLEEVIVVGYGTQKKSDIVGAISSVPKDRLENNPSPNFYQALQGAAPGVYIQRGSGAPGNSGSIQIRGRTSVSASNNPLIIFDGIPFSGEINDINTNDIASVEVLKDASASAIYGSRAANGVILITSKRGSDGKTVVELNASWSVQNEAVKYQLFGPDDFYAFRQEAFRTDGLLDGVSDQDIPKTILEVNELKSYERGESVDWMDEMINQNAMVQNYQISVRTGNKNLKEYFSVSYNDEEGLQRTTGFERITLKNNMEITGISDWITLGNNTLFSITEYERREFSRNNQPAYYRLSPFARIYEDDGSYTKFPQANDDLFINPIAEDELTERENKFNNLFNNLYFVISPSGIEGLSFRMNLGTTFRNTDNSKYLRRGTFIGDAVGGQASSRSSKTLDVTWENILSYSKKFGEHSIDVTGLFSRQYNKYEYFSAESSGFVSDDYLWYNLGAGELIGTPQSELREWNLVSYMGRLNYNFKDKYYLTATGRRDGYSGFATNNKYGFFPSFAAAWRISQENFMGNINWLEDLKLRASYGSVGNQAVGTYRSLARLGLAQHIFGNELTAGLRTVSLPNNNLGWETTNTLNVGIDYDIFGGRITGSFEYYNSRTENILLNRGIPRMTGQRNITFNIGEVQNKGFEASMNIYPIQQGDFSWKLGLNFSMNKNEILDLYGDGKDDVQNQWFIGEPLGIIYGEEANGIYQLGEESEIAESATPDRAPGDTRIVDQNNDGVIDADDRVILGYTQPKWLGGVNNTFTWKDLSLNIFVQAVQGNKARFNPEGSWGRVNRPPVDYWTPENPSNTWFRPSMSNIPYFGSLNVYDAGFVRIKDITLSYNLPATLLSKMPLSNLRVYANLHDYFTFTKFPYVDPEVGSAVNPNNGAESSGYEMSIPKFVQFGFNVKF